MREVPAPHTADKKQFFPINHVRKTITVSDERPQEECGLLSFYAPNGMTTAEASKIFTAAEGVQHRGQQGGGLVAYSTTGESFIHRGFGLLSEALPATIQEQVANLGDLQSVTLQARYGTHGGYEPNNLQPLETIDQDGTTMHVSENGNHANVNEILQTSGLQYDYDVSDSRIWSDDLPNTEGITRDDRIINAVQNIRGASSLLINAGNDTLYAARDGKGIRPLVLGQMQGEKGTIYVIASETKALGLIQATTVRDIRPGEVTRFDRDGMTVLEKGEKSAERMCGLEFPYMSHPDSQVNVTSNGASPETWPRLVEKRFEIGRQIAKEDKAREIAAAAKAKRLGGEYKPFKPDIVIGIPESGKPFGEGYAQEMDVPYQQLITKDPENLLRMFQTDNKLSEIEAGILKKLDFDEDWNWEGKVVVLADDSLVRGSASTTISKVLTGLGAQVHWRFGFPKISHPCHLGVSIRTYDELIAYRQNGDEEKIAKEIGAASVQYISNRGFVESVQGDHFEPTSDPTELFDANRMCGGCVTGEYPYPREETVYQRPTAQVS